MSEYFKISLCEGRRVRDPHTGTYLEMGKVYKFLKKQFWLRRLDCEDVCLYEEPKPAGKEFKKKKNKESGEK